ncbi:MAG: hypothetical protein KA521_00120 [Crocinitomicaceae bacterium]|nr:hypothetical protein [Crocinitomicaceae bacterium]
MKFIFSCSILLVLLFSCNSNKLDSKNPYAAYFYEVDSIPKIYLYRDIAHGLDEQFHRIFKVEDSQGEHIVVEVYSADGRIIEALNYNVDSLDIMDHMVVNRNDEKTKAELFKYKLIPMNAQEEVSFASRFQGFLDSTLILREVKRKVKGPEISWDVLGENEPTICFVDRIRMTNFNPFTKKENVQEGDAISYYAKGYGLVEWHTKNKKAHYRLEKVLSQKEFLSIITR